MIFESSFVKRRFVFSFHFTTFLHTYFLHMKFAQQQKVLPATRRMAFVAFGLSSLKICGAGQLKDPAAAVPWKIFQHLSKDIYQMVKNHSLKASGFLNRELLKQQNLIEIATSFWCISDCQILSTTVDGILILLQSKCICLQTSACLFEGCPLNAQHNIFAILTGLPRRHVASVPKKCE